MSEEVILRAGIDVGTSTTQLIFSRMTIKNTAGFGKVPKTEIVSKDIFYRSKIYFTPFLSSEIIDGAKVHEIIKKEYETAGISPKDLSTGAVIITGETSRKKNAKQVLESLSDIAGDFVVATAGPDLESILAGKGAGAGEISKKSGKVVANLDIGGGTTNICYFKDGEVYDTACLDIGGRLVKIEDGRITYIADKVQDFINKYQIPVKIHERADVQHLELLTDKMAEILAQSVNLCKPTEDLVNFRTNRLITVNDPVEILTFSGGVASCMDQEYDVLQFGDIGVLLAKSIMKNRYFMEIKTAHAMETMRATVIGAGNYSMNISGSTIEYTQKDFPIKNLPIGKIRLENEADIEKIGTEMQKAIDYFRDDGEEVQIALAMKGLACPGFLQIQEIAANIMETYDTLFDKNIKLILILEADIGKALGQALKRINSKGRDIVCIDNISCNSGDYIDLGQPIANGSVIPVVVKTLVFQG